MPHRICLIGKSRAGGVRADGKTPLAPAPMPRPLFGTRRTDNPIDMQNEVNELLTR